MEARGGGADGNPPNRFESMHLEVDEDARVDEDPRPLRTVFLRDLDHLQELARHAAVVVYLSVRLPGAVAEVFGSWLDRHQPLAKEKILGRIRSTHAGKLNSNDPVVRMRGTGGAAAQWKAMFQTCCRKHGLHPRTPELGTEAFRRLTPGQGELF